MLRYNRNRARGRFFPLFSPRELFYGSVPGAWYDPTDLSTMFQDSTGTTPVTAVEQPVGLILDKSQGLALGPELVTNGDFSAGTTGWTGTNVTLSIENGMLKAVSNAAGSAVVAQNATLPLTGRVLSRYYVQPPAGRSVAVFVRNNAAQSAITTTGVYQSVVQPAGTTEAIAFLWTAAAAGEIAYFDDITVRTIAGNHASQSTAASRPTYRARYNLLTYSEQFDNAVWFRQALAGVTANAAVAPDGTTTADLVIADNTSTSTHRIASTPAVTTISGTSYTFSVYAKKSGAYEGLALTVDAPAVYVAFDLTNGVAGAGGTITNVGNGWFRCSVTFTAGASTLCRVWTFDTYANAAAQAAWTGNGTTGILLWGAQLLTAADVTATGNAYQRIAAATVYDTAPVFRPYLAFDGVDDSLSTAAINFSTTQKMTLFAGVTKNTDSSAGIIGELTASADANAGGFNFVATNAAGYYMQCGAPLDRVYGIGTSFTTAAPTTDVATVSYDRTIASSVAQIQYRTDAQGPSSAGLVLQGVGASGAFANAAFFIGRRNNASLPFNGRIYELIVRGAASSVTEIADTELWVNARTGGY